MRAAKIAFWGSVGLLAYTQVGYPVVLLAWSRLTGPAPQDPAPAADHPEPTVSLIVAAHDEESVIAAKVANALGLDWPRDKLELIVSCDGCTDDTAARARAAGADTVLELPRGGKIRAQDAAVRAATGELLAFCDANSTWDPDAMRQLTAAFEDPRVGYACGQVRSSGPTAATTRRASTGATRWRPGARVPAASITAGNGAIYATRRGSYINVDPIMGHDQPPIQDGQARLAGGLRAGARAREKMVRRRRRVRPQAADDEPRLADRHPRRDALARGDTGQSTR